MAQATAAKPAKEKKPAKKKLIQSAFSDGSFKKKSQALLKKYNNASLAIEMVDVPNKAEIIKQLQKAYNSELKKLIADEEL